MSDELPRPTPGSAPRRRPSDAPSWWAELERSDLPDGREPAWSGASPGPTALPAPRGRGAARGSRGHADTVAPVTDTPTSAARTRTLVSTVLVVVAAILIAWVGIGAGSIRSVLVVLLVFGVPCAVAAVVVAAVARKAS